MHRIFTNRVRMPAIVMAAVLMFDTRAPAQIGTNPPGHASNPSVRYFGRSHPGTAKAPILEVTGLPLMGAHLRLSISGGPANRMGFLMLGLPLEEGILLPSGHALHVLSTGDMLPFQLDSGGANPSILTIPRLPAAAQGFTVAAQAAVFQPQLPAGAVSSRALEVTITAPVPGPRFPRQILPLPPHGDRALAADLDGNGHDDILVFDPARRDALVLIADGDGFFEAPSIQAILPAPLPVGEVPTPTIAGVADLWCGDLNGDGIPDAVATDGGTNLVIRHGDGFGRIPLQQHLTAGQAMELVAAGDLNGDGQPELVVADNGPTPCLRIFMLQAEGVWVAHPLPIPLSHPVAHLALGDRTGNGIADLAAVLLTPSGQNVLLTALGAWPQGFGPHHTQPIPGAVVDLQVTSLNNDPRADIAVLVQKSPRPQLLLWTRDPAQSPGAPDHSWLLTAGSTPQGMLVGDWNADGAVDLGASGTTMTLIPSDGLGGWGAMELLPLGGNGAPIAVAAQVVGPGQGIVWLDGGARILLPGQNGRLADQRMTPLSTASELQQLMDLDGDGHLDALLTEGAAMGRLAIAPGRGDGSFEAPQPITTTAAIGVAQAIAADMDGDGDSDLISLRPNDISGPRIRLWRNDGNFTFSAQSSSAIGADPTCMAVGDIDGDGWPDVVVACRGPAQLELFRNLGGMVLGSAAPSPIRPDPLAMAMADMNGDGIIDPITLHGVSREVVVHLPGGPGFLLRGARSTGGVPRDVVAMDLDRDGALDLVVATDQAPTGIKTFRGNGDGTLQPSQNAPGCGNVPCMPASVCAAEVTGDGIPDLVAATDHGEVWVLVGDGHGAFRTPDRFGGGVGRGEVAAADIDHDGLPDIVRRGGESQGRQGLRSLTHQHGGRK